MGSLYAPKDRKHDDVPITEVGIFYEPKISVWRRIKNFFNRLLPVEPALEIPAPVRGRTAGFGGAVVEAHTELKVEHIRNGRVIGEQTIYDRVVTNAGRDAIVDAFSGTFDLSTFNHHDSGTGTNAEAVGDTALQTPTTEARVAGTQSQPTSDVYRSIATITYAGARAVTEHGLFSQAAKPGGTLLDRTVFAAVNVVADDSVQFTFTIAFAAGG